MNQAHLRAKADLLLAPANRAVPPAPSHGARHGAAWITNPATNAEWKMRFIWPLTSTYLVLELDPDYRWAVVGTPGRDLLWILARDRQLSPADYEHILGLIAAQGYDRATIVPVPQPGSEVTARERGEGVPRP